MLAPTPRALAVNDAPLTLAAFIYEPRTAMLFQVRDIVSIHAGSSQQANYTEVALTNGKRASFRKAIARILPRLPPCFFLARRGCVINLHHIRDIAPIDRRLIAVTLSDLSEVIISRKQLLLLGRQRGL